MLIFFFFFLFFSSFDSIHLLPRTVLNVYLPMVGHPEPFHVDLKTPVVNVLASLATTLGLDNLDDYMLSQSVDSRM